MYLAPGLSECYHQLQLKRTRKCKKLNESSITMHTVSELRCTHDDLKIVSEYDQEILQSQTADNPMAPQGRATQPSRDTRGTN